MRIRYRHHNEKSDTELGFDLVSHWIGVGIEWVFYVIFFPIHYPLSLLGKRRRAELDADPDTPEMSVEQILAEARKRR